MRFLFGTRPFIGHLYPMVPLGRELVHRGHSVVVASSDEVKSAATEAGLEFMTAGVHPDFPLLDAGGSVVRSPGFSDAIHARKIADIVLSARPDVVVREPTDIASGIAAEALGVPSVVLGRSQYLSTSAWRQVLRGDLDGLRHSVGLESDPSLETLNGDVYLDGVPPWFYQQVPVGDFYRPIDAGTYDGTSRLPLAHYPPMPYVYVTLGTAYNGDADFYRVALQAAESNGLGVVVGAGSAAAAAELRESSGKNCVVHAFVPQSQILCGACLVLCHGGFSTVLGALRAGVPLICVPHGSDHEGNARQCESLGVGRRVSRAEWTVPEASRLVAEMVADPAAAERTRSLAERDRDRPTVRQVAQLLEELPDLSPPGERPTARLDRLNAAAHDYGAVNRIGWQRLSVGGCASSRPVRHLSHDTARQAVDPRQWLPWSDITTVLCLAGGGGQQGPQFAAAGCEVLVADVSTEQLRREREAAEAYDVHVETIEIDMCDLGVLGQRQFDLVYQPVSSCYVPDLARLFAQVARHVRPSGWYWSQHYCPTHLQLDPALPWDGAAYRLSRPLVEGERVGWSSPEGHATVNHYVHGVGAIAGGVCDAGFTIRRMAEDGPTRSAIPGEAGHLAAYLRPFVTVLARRETP